MVAFRGLLNAVSRAIPALRLASALAAVLLILTPAELWSAPSHDLTVEGFDSETVYVDERGGRYVFAPFQVLTNGGWEACPCAPSSYLVLVGSDLSPVTRASSDGAASLAGISVTVDGKPTRVFAVSPNQVNFFLRADVTAPASTVALFRDGREIGRQSVAVEGSMSPGPLVRSEVAIEPSQMRLLAEPGSQPAVHLLTTPLSFQASFDVVIEEGRSGRPFQAMLWNPRDFGSVSIIFGPAPDRTVEAVVTEEKGKITARHDLGRYRIGEPYHVQVELARREHVEVSVRPAQGPEMGHQVILNSEEAPDLFDAFRPSLTVLSHSVADATKVTISDYRLELPHERFLTSRAQDKKILPLVLALLLFSIALHAGLMFRTGQGLWSGLQSFQPRNMASALFGPWWRTLIAVTIGAGLAVGLGFLMTLGSHPFDMASQKIWTYLLVTDGIGDLYYRAQTVPVADIWGGMPFHEAVYPYGVSMSYYFYAIGWLHQLFGGDVSPDSKSLEVTIKAVSLVVGLGVAGLLMALSQGLGRARFALLIPLAFILNPAILFDVAVWGATEPVALFFLFASMLAAQRRSARWAWVLLALTFLGKPTIVLPAVLTGVYYLRLFPIRRTLEGFSVAVPAVLAAVLPYVAAGYSPSIAIDPIIGVLQVFGGDEMDEAFQVVSFDAYNVWPLVTLLGHGEHGVGRLNFPDSANYLGPFSYHQLGLLAFAVVLGGVVIWLLTSRRVGKEPGLIFLVLAFATLAELVLPTRAIARYLLFPMVFALLGTRSAPTWTTWLVVATLTSTSLIGMYGSLATGLESAPTLAPHLAPSTNFVTDAALRLFRSDIVITLGSLLNLAALLALARSLWMPKRDDSPAPSWEPRLQKIATQVPPTTSLVARG